MAIVYIPAQLRELTGGVAQVRIDQPSVRKIVAALEEQFPGLGDRLCPGGSLSSGLAVSVDGAVTPRGLLAQVKPESEVHFLPAIGGG